MLTDRRVMQLEPAREIVGGARLTGGKAIGIERLDDPPLLRRQGVNRCQRRIAARGCAREVHHWPPPVDDGAPAPCSCPTCVMFRGSLSSLRPAASSFALSDLISAISSSGS